MGLHGESLRKFLAGIYPPSHKDADNIVELSNKALNFVKQWNIIVHNEDKLKKGD